VELALRGFVWRNALHHYSKYAHHYVEKDEAIQTQKEKVPHNKQKTHQSATATAAPNEYRLFGSL